SFPSGFMAVVRALEFPEKRLRRQAAAAVNEAEGEYRLDFPEELRQHISSSQNASPAVAASRQRARGRGGGGSLETESASPCLLTPLARAQGTLDWPKNS
ncbi:MAG: hypothetical protein WCJ21_04175, partial [Planctomycetota bacterium]